MSVFRYQALEVSQLQDPAKKKSFQDTVKANLAQNDERRNFTVQPSLEKDRVLSVIDRLLDFWWFNVTSFLERPLAHTRFLLRCQRQGLRLAPSILTQLGLDSDQYELALPSTQALMDADLPVENGGDEAGGLRPHLDYKAIKRLYQKRFPFRNNDIANVFSDPEHGFSLLFCDRYLYDKVLPQALEGSALESDCLEKKCLPYWTVSFHAKMNKQSLFQEQDWTLSFTIHEGSSEGELSGYCFSDFSTIDAVFKHIDMVLNQAVFQARGSLCGYSEQLYPFFLAPHIAQTGD
ncbi:MAG: hypothetical protein LBD79_09070 [Treponema sp.]|jgi:hypothetical protein|nr:hypothetical protein [Treponema sp.]